MFLRFQLLQLVDKMVLERANLLDLRQKTITVMNVQDHGSLT